MLKTFVKTKIAFDHLARRFTRDESGASLVEYSAALGVILVVSIAILLLLGAEVSRIFQAALDGMIKIKAPAAA